MRHVQTPFTLALRNAGKAAGTFTYVLLCVWRGGSEIAARIWQECEQPFN